MNEQEKKQQPLRGFPVTFNVYARDEMEAEELRMAIVAFIGHHAQCGRAVTAAKAARAIANWDRNPLVRNQIIQYFQD